MHVNWLMQLFCELHYLSEKDRAKGLLPNNHLTWLNKAENVNSGLHINGAFEYTVKYYLYLLNEIIFLFVY